MRWLSVMMMACGEPVIGPGFLGTPLFGVGGAVVQTSSSAPDLQGELAVGLFWIGAGADYRPSRIEQNAELDAGLGTYRLTLFERPPAGAATFEDVVDDGDLGLAVIALYADEDGSGALDVSIDRVVGASQQHVIAWASHPVGATTGAAGLLGGIGPGYHLFEYDRESRCAFVAAAGCPGEGGLFEVAADTPVVLTLHADPAFVLVPSPFLDRMVTSLGSIWARP